MEVGDVATWFAAGVAIIAAVIAMNNANSAKTQAGAALKQASEAKKAREAAEASVAEARTANELAKQQLTLAAADREDRAKQEQRGLVLELLHSGRGYASALDGLILVMGVLADSVELTNSDTWKTFERAKAGFDKALLQARYSVKQPEIRAVIGDLDTVLASSTERTAKLGTSQRDARGHAPIEDIIEAAAIPKMINLLMDQLAELAERDLKGIGAGS